MRLATPVAFAALAIATVRLQLDTPVSIWRTERELPLLYWTVTVAYASAFALVARLPLRPTLLAGIGPGLAVHLLLLLSAANVQAHSDPAFFDNRWFYAYFYAVYFSALGAAALAAGMLVRGIQADARRDRHDMALWSYLPFALAFAFVVAEAAVLRLWPETVVAGLLFAATATGRERGAKVLVALRRIRASIERREWVVPAGAALILFALVVATNVSLVRQLGDRFPLNFDDGDFYDAMGWTTATGARFREDIGPVEGLWSFRNPGYPLFVGLVYWLFSRNFIALGVIQAALAALIPIAVYYLAKRMFDVATARIAALLSALSGLLISVLVGLRSESLYAVFSATFMLTVLAAETASSAPRRILLLALGSGLLAYGILIKPQAIAFAPLLLLWWSWREFSHRRPLRTFVASLVMAAAAMVIVAGPVVARDLEANGRFTLISVGKPSETWLINHAGARLVELGVTAPNLAVLLEVFSRRPMEVLTILWEELPRNVLEYFTGFWFGKGDPLLLQRFTDFANNVTLYGYALAILGLVVGMRLAATRPQQLLVLAYIAANSLVVVLVAYPAVRYRIPLDPLLFIWVGVGTVWLGRQIFRADRAVRALHVGV